MAEKSLKQLLNDRTRQKDKIQKMQYLIVAEKKALKEIRKAIKDAKDLMKGTAPKKIRAKKVSKKSPDESQGGFMQD